MVGVGLKSRRISTAEAVASSCRPVAIVMTRFMATGKGANRAVVHEQRPPATQIVNVSAFMILNLLRYHVVYKHDDDIYILRERWR